MIRKKYSAPKSYFRLPVVSRGQHIYFVFLAYGGTVTNEIILD